MPFISGVIIRRQQASASMVDEALAGEERAEREADRRYSRHSIGTGIIKIAAANIEKAAAVLTHLRRCSSSGPTSARPSR
jgi:hypothetical protein